MYPGVFTVINLNVILILFITLCLLVQQHFVVADEPILLPLCQRWSGTSWEPHPDCRLEGEWHRKPNATCGKYVSTYKNLCYCQRAPGLGWYPCPWEYGDEPIDIFETSLLTPEGWYWMIMPHEINYYPRPCDVPQPDAVCVHGSCNGDTAQCECDSMKWAAGGLCDELEVFTWVPSDWGSCDFLPNDENGVPFGQDYQPHCGQLYQHRTANCVAQSTGVVVDDSWCFGTAVDDGSFPNVPRIPLIQPCTTTIIDDIDVNDTENQQQYDNDETYEEKQQLSYIPCQNNGQCNNSTSQCICPFGTHGDLCEEQYIPQYTWDYTEWSEECHNIYPTQKCGVQAQYRKARCYEIHTNITINDITKCFESSIGGISDVLFNTTLCGVINNNNNINKDTNIVTELSLPQQSSNNVCGATIQYHGYCASYDDNGVEYIDFDAENNNYIIFDGIIKLINNYTLNPNTIDNYINQNLIITTHENVHEDQIPSYYDHSVDLFNLPFFDCSCQPGFYGEYCDIPKDVHWVVTDWGECQHFEQEKQQQYYQQQHDDDNNNEFNIFKPSTQSSSTLTSSCGRPYRESQVTCQIVDNGNYNQNYDDDDDYDYGSGIILSNQHPSCLAIASQMPVNIDFTTCNIDKTQLCQNGGVCMSSNKGTTTGGNINNNIFIPSHALQPLECQCLPGWSGAFCHIAVNITNIPPNQSGGGNNQPPRPPIIPKRWAITPWTQCMLLWEYQVMAGGSINKPTPTTNITVPKGCDEYRRYRSVYCIIENHTTQTTTVIDDNECIQYYQYLQLQQDFYHAMNSTYTPITILTTKPLQEESCFMYYPPCNEQKGPFIGSNLTNTDHIDRSGDQYLEEEQTNSGVTSFICNSIYNIMIIAILLYIS